MNTILCSTKSNLCAPAFGAFFLLAVALGMTPRACAAVATQLESFFYNDGSLVVSDNGEPDDAVLNRLHDTPHSGIEWQLMTQHLAPGAWYDIWLEGTNDGTEAGSFRWWVGRVRATPRGAINAMGTIYVNQPLGPSVGQFTNPLAQICLVIRSTAGAPLQIAFFPAL